MNNITKKLAPPMKTISPLQKKVGIHPFIRTYILYTYIFPNNWYDRKNIPVIIELTLQFFVLLGINIMTCIIFDTNRITDGSSNIIVSPNFLGYFFELPP